jgi:thymidylate synthase (FAD)
LVEVKKIAPTLFKKAGASCVSLGYCKEGKMCCGRFPTLEQLINKSKKEDK